MASKKIEHPNILKVAQYCDPLETPEPPGLSSRTSPV